MFRATILSIFRSTRLCVTASGIMHRRCCRPVAWKRRKTASRLPACIIPAHCTTSCNAQSSAPEDGRDQRPKQVELIGIINKPLLLHLVGVYIIYINDARWGKYQIFWSFRHTSIGQLFVLDQGCGHEASPSWVRSFGGNIIGRDWWQQAERKDWDRNKQFFLLNFLAVPDTNNLVWNVEFTWIQ